jgi:16S rRNA (cytidine1402-2'-O)-methyltransferase
VLRAVEAETRTLVCYESPHRLLASLEDILDVLGNRYVAVARELTKVHEEIVRGELSEAIAHFRKKGVRGEFTLVIQGAGPDAQPPRPSAEEVLALARQLMEGGLSARDSAAEVARRTGWSRRDVYNRLHGPPTGAESGES